MKRQAACYLAVGLMSAWGLVLLGCPTAPKPTIENTYQQVDAPEANYTLMKLALAQDKQDLFYYLLSQDVRSEYSYTTIQLGWGEIKSRLNLDVENSRLLSVAYLAESPFPPKPAARLTVEYPHPDGGNVVESFLLLLEQARGDYGEKFPQWRVYYPYEPYQANTVWFQKLRESNSNKPTTNANSNPNVTANSNPR